MLAIMIFITINLVTLLLSYSYRILSPLLNGLCVHLYLNLEVGSPICLCETLPH